jgi:CheY-like chemotaxis protein
MDYLILLADDNEKLRHSLAGALEEAGYPVVEAATGKEALGHLNSSTEFDLLITDVMMPDMNGLQVLTEIRRTDPDLPVIMMSGACNEGLLRFASAFGIPTLEKPVKGSALVKIAESVLWKKASPALR